MLGEGSTVEAPARCPPASSLFPENWLCARACCLRCAALHAGPVSSGLDRVCGASGR